MGDWMLRLWDRLRDALDTDRECPLCDGTLSRERYDEGFSFGLVEGLEGVRCDTGYFHELVMPAQLVRNAKRIQKVRLAAGGGEG